jgi:hypothetical protein
MTVLYAFHCAKAKFRSVCTELAMELAKGPRQVSDRLVCFLPSQAKPDLQRSLTMLMFASFPLYTICLRITTAECSVYGFRTVFVVNGGYSNKQLYPADLCHGEVSCFL